MLVIVYILLAVVGCGYVLLSAVLGHLLDFHDVGHDAGAGSADAGHADGDYGDGGHGKVTHADTAAAPTFHFPFFSPLAISTLVAAIGGYGLITKVGMGMNDGPSIASSVIAALVTAYVITYIAWKVVIGSIGSSRIRTSQLVGATAEIITPIPENGMGEIAIVVHNQRVTGPARSVDGKPVPRGAAVKVYEMLGTTYVVGPLVSKGESL